MTNVTNCRRFQCTFFRIFEHFQQKCLVLLPFFSHYNAKEQNNKKHLCMQSSLKEWLCLTHNSLHWHKRKFVGHGALPYKRLTNQCFIWFLPLYFGKQHLQLPLSLSNESTVKMFFFFHVVEQSIPPVAFRSPRAKCSWTNVRCEFSCQVKAGKDFCQGSLIW